MPITNPILIQSGEQSTFVKVLFKVFLLAIAIFPLLIASGSGDFSNPQGSAAPDFAKVPFLLYSTLVILIILFFSPQSKNLIWRSSNLFTCFILFLLWATLSILWSFNLFFNLFFLLKWYLAFFVLLAVNCLVQDEEDILSLLIAIIVSSCFSQLLGISQAYQITPDFIAKVVPQAIPPASTFGNRNMAMHFLVVTSPLLFYFFLTIKGKPGLKAVLFFMMAIFFTYILFSKNRTTWVGLILQVILVIVIFFGFIWPNRAKLINHPINRGFRWWKVAGFIFALLLGVGVLFSLASDGTKSAVQNRLESLNKKTKTGRTENPRFYQFANTAHMIKDVFNPNSKHFIKGLGMGQWTIYYPQYMGSNLVQDSMHPLLSRSNILYKQTHNEYLQIFAELGIIGFLLFVAIISLLILHLFRLLRYFFSSEKEDDYKRGIMMATLSVAFIGISSSMAFSFPLRVAVPLPIMVIYFFIVEFYYRQYCLTPEPQEKNIDTKQTNQGKASKHPISILYRHFLLPCYHYCLKHRDYRFSSVLGAVLAVALAGFLYFSYQYLQVWEEAHRARNLAAGRIGVLSRIQDDQLRKQTLEAIRRDLAKSIRINPSDPDDASFILANMYRNERRFKKSAEVIDRAFNTIHPYHIYMYRVQVSNYLNLKEYPKALEVLRMGIQNFANQAIFYKDMGELLYQFGQIDQAIPYLAKALTLEPDIIGGDSVKKILEEYQQKQRQKQQQPQQ